MEDIVIEKNIPVSGSRLRHSVVKSTLQTMEVGDSFLIPQDRRSTFSAAAKRLHPKRFVSRTTDGGKVRFWRIE